MKSSRSLYLFTIGAVLALALPSIAKATPYWQGTGQVFIGATTATATVSGGNGQVYMTNQTSMTASTSISLTASGGTAAGTLPASSATGYFYWSTNSTTPGTGTWTAITATVGQANSGGGTTVTLTASITPASAGTLAVYAEFIVPGPDVVVMPGHSTGSPNIVYSGTTLPEYSYAANSVTEMTVNAALQPTTFNITPTIFIYNGAAQGPSNGNPYPGGATYTLSGNSQVNVGTYIATATANGAYSGSGSQQWWILDSGSQIIVSPVYKTTSSGQTISNGNALTVGDSIQVTNTVSSATGFSDISENNLNYSINNTTSYCWEGGPEWASNVNWRSILDPTVNTNTRTVTLPTPTASETVYMFAEGWSGTNSNSRAGGQNQLPAVSFTFGYPSIGYSGFADGSNSNLVYRGDSSSFWGTANPAGVDSSISTVKGYITINGNQTLIGTATLSGTNWSLTMPGSWSSGLAAGSYSVNFIATDSFGNTSSVGNSITVSNVSQTIGLTVNANPSGGTSGSDIYAGGPASLTASGGANGYTWSAGGGATGISGNAATQTITFPTAGSYAVSVYSPAGGNYGQSNTASTTIHVANQPSGSLSSSAGATINFGQSTTVSATFTADTADGDSFNATMIASNPAAPGSGGGNQGGYWGNSPENYFFNWSGTNGNLSAVFTPSAIGTYTFYAMGDPYDHPAWGLLAQSTVTVNPEPTSFTFSPTLFLYNGSSQGPAPAPTPAGATSSVTAGTGSAIAPGEYSETVSANGNYTGSSSTSWALAPPAPAVTATYNAVALNSSGGVLSNWGTLSSGATIYYGQGIQAVNTVTSSLGWISQNNLFLSYNNGPWSWQGGPLYTYAGPASVNGSGVSNSVGNEGEYTISNITSGITSVSRTMYLSPSLGFGMYQLANEGWTGFNDNIRPWGWSGSGTSSGTFTFTYAQATPAATFSNQTLNYGASLSGLLSANFYNPWNSNYTTPPSGTVTYSAYNTDTSSSVGTVNASAVLPAGHYTITASYPGDSNYNATTATATFTVNKAPLTITPNNQSKVYGAALPGLTAAYSGFVNGDSSLVVSGLNVTTTASASSPVGNYPITASGASAANYVISYGGPATLTVTQASLTITGNSPTKVYGQTDPTLSVTDTGLVNGDTPSSITGLTVTTTAGTGSAAGTYNVTPSGATDPNYTITEDPGTLTVSQAPLTATANNATVTYSGVGYSGGNGITYSGFVNGDTASVVTGAPTYTGTSQGAIHPGSYVITPGGTSATNYAITFANGTLKINQALPTETWATPAPITYPAALTSTQLDATGSVPGTISYVDTSNGNAAVVVGTVLTAGTHVLTANLVPTDSTDYASAVTTVSLVVHQGTPTITWAAPSAITYGTALSPTQLDATANVPGSFAYSGQDYYSDPLTIANGTILFATAPYGGPTTLTATFTPTDTTDYATATANVLITVNQATYTASLSPTTAVYNGAYTKPTLVLTPSNATVTAPIPSSGFYTVGTYSTPVVAYGNFTGTYNLTYTVTAAPMTITCTNVTKTYGTTYNFTGSEFTATGLQGADAFYFESPTSTGAASTATVGTYPIIPATLSTINNLNAANGNYYYINFNVNDYSATYVNGTMTVTQAPQTITLTPATSTVAVNGTVGLTAAGGLGTGSYVWSVSPTGPTGLSGSGASQTLTFPGLGTFTVSVYHSGSTNYAQSNTATASVVVAPVKPTVAAIVNVPYPAAIFPGDPADVGITASTSDGVTTISAIQLQVSGPNGFTYSQSWSPNNTSTNTASNTFTLPSDLVHLPAGYESPSSSAGYSPSTGVGQYTATVTATTAAGTTTQTVNFNAVQQYYPETITLQTVPPADWHAKFFTASPQQQLTIWESIQR